MRHRRLLIVVAGLVIFGSAASDHFPQIDVEKPKVQLFISSSKNTYIQGEVVQLTVRLENKGFEKILLRGNLHEASNKIAFDVSVNGKDFVRYSNPEWGRHENVSRLIRPHSGSIWLQPDESIEGFASILWNDKPEVDHMNPMHAAWARKGKILTDYAFPETGRYYLKAIYYGINDAEGRSLKIESEPIEITVEEPGEKDSKVWKKTWSRGDIAYFVQETRLPYKGADGKDLYDKSRQEKFEQELRAIVTEHPDSILAKQIGQGLEDLRIRRERWKTDITNCKESQDRSEPFELMIKSSTLLPVVGEKVEFKLCLRNNSFTARKFRAHFHTNSGDIRFYVSRDGVSFREYAAASKPFTHEGLSPPMKSGWTFATLYWNGKQPSDLGSVDANDGTSANYVFPEAGVYIVKATWDILIDGLKKTKIESGPVRIRIEDPAAEDLTVWEMIRGRADIASFLQKGWFDGIELNKEAELRNEIMSAANRYQTSVIARSLGRTLLELVEVEKERTRLRETLKRNAQVN